MANKYLSRDEAPIGPEVWEILDNTLVSIAKSMLAGRRLLHVEGPYGLGLKAVPLQDAPVEPGLFTSPAAPVSWIHIAFTLGKRDLAAYERDKISLNLSELAGAAMECARLEDELVFNGRRQVAGLLTVPGSSSLELSSWDEVGAAADDIIKGVTSLDGAGFHGPYTLALAPGRYNLLFRRYPTGQATELEHVKTVVTEGVFKAPALAGGGVLLASGRQFASIVLGQDMTIGFIGPQDERLQFSISESLVLFIRAAGAICILKG